MFFILFMAKSVANLNLIKYENGRQNESSLMNLIIATILVDAVTS